MDQSESRQQQPNPQQKPPPPLPPTANAQYRIHQFSTTKNDQSELSGEVDTNHHLYNTPGEFFNKKDQIEVFSNKPIVVHSNSLPPPNLPKPLTTADAGNASATSSVTLLTVDGDRQLPITIWLGVVQLLLSVTLTALGVLMIAREAALAKIGSGIWAGAICGIAGALGVINVRKAQTGFLAGNLICVASSTLALALTGIGLVRDVNLVSA